MLNNSLRTLLLIVGIALYAEPGAMTPVRINLQEVQQRIDGFGEAFGRNGKPRCALILDPNLVQTVLLPHKPIQGWRYMEVDFAPADLTTAERKVVSSLPQGMADELRSLGLL